ncbi:MAG: hypothetical protein AAFO74_13090 [Pseudomonadota bacterium]
MMLSLSALWTWAKGVPEWVWMATAAALGIYLIRRDAYRDGHEDGADEVIEDIEESTNEAIERVERVERTTADLNREQLRKLAAGSRYNRTRVSEDQAD